MQMNLQCKRKRLERHRVTYKTEQVGKEIEVNGGLLADIRDLKVAPGETLDSHILPRCPLMSLVEQAQVHSSKSFSDKLQTLRMPRVPHNQTQVAIMRAVAMLIEGHPLPQLYAI